MKPSVDEVLSQWRSLATIAHLLQIDEDTVFEKVFAGRQILQKKIFGNDSFIYIMLYKEANR